MENENEGEHQITRITWKAYVKVRIMGTTGELGWTGNHMLKWYACVLFVFGGIIFRLIQG